MITNHLVFKSLHDTWIARNKDLYFYFNEIFPKVLEAVISKAYSDNINIGIYKSIFMPVGFAIENITLVAAALKPQTVRLAYTEVTRRFHLRHIHLFEDQLSKFIPSIKIDEITITCDDQQQMEKVIVEWVNEMKDSYGVSYREMAIDMTGGTKPMSIGAHNAAVSFDKIDAFYLRTDYDLDTKQPMPGTERLIKVRKVKAQVDDKMVFVAMPFKDEFKDVYEKGIQAATCEIGMKCIRVDEQVFTGPIMDKINDNIVKASVIITELTEYNPNVFYELGLAHGYNKKVIMLTQDISKIPFDLRHLRIVAYEKSVLDFLKEQLKTEILNIIKD